MRLSPVLACALCLCLCFTSVYAFDASVTGSGHSVGFGELEEEWRGEVIHLSWNPRAFLLKGFLSEEECDHIIETAKPNLGEPSSEGKHTGSMALITTKHDEIIAKIENRVAQICMIPEENQEKMHVMHWSKGQEYKPHTDFFMEDGQTIAKNNAQRAATLLMYLTASEEGSGGETIFTKSEAKPTSGSWSECAKNHFALRPQRGDAVLLYALKPTGDRDNDSEHASCPVLSGEKWIAAKYIYTKKFEPFMREDE
eukprot:gene12778-16035_t